MVLADFQVGQVVWSLLWFTLFFLWIWLLITIFADIIRSDDLSGWAKALWTIAILFLPFLGVLVYLIARGHTMADRQVQQAQEADQAMRAYIQDAAGASSADELAKLAELHDNGTLSDDEYARAKAKILG